MAYSVTGIDYCTAWLTASYRADDGTEDLEQLTCMTNGTLGDQCDELKIGTTVLKIGINQDPATIVSLSIRFYFTSSMADGDNEITPYTDTNTVSGTNAVNKTYGAAEVNSWVEHVLSAALIAELGDVGGKCYLRLAASDATAKTKLGEVNIDMVIQYYEINGITKDFNGDALGSCEVSAFKSLGSGVYTYAGTTTSDVTTGAYTIGTLGPGTYKAIAHKTGSPAVFDVTDFLTAVISPTTTTTTTTV